MSRPPVPEPRLPLSTGALNRFLYQKVISQEETPSHTRTPAARLGWDPTLPSPAPHGLSRRDGGAPWAGPLQGSTPPQFAWDESLGVPFPSCSGVKTHNKFVLRSCHNIASWSQLWRAENKDPAYINSLIDRLACDNSTSMDTPLH